MRERVADRLGELALLADEARAFRAARARDRRQAGVIVLGGRRVARPARGRGCRSRFDRARRCAASASLAIGEASATAALVEAAAHMRPAEGEAHVALFCERAIAGVAVDLKDALEAGEMRDRLRGLAVGRIDIGDRRRVRSAPGPIVSRIGPELAGLGAPATRDRAPAPSSRRRTASSTTSDARECAHGRGADGTRRVRPSRRASSDRDERPGARKSAPGDRAASGRRIWRRARARPSLRSAGRPRSAAPGPAIGRRRPRRRGRRIWAGARPARGTARERRRASRSRPRRSGEARPCSTGRPCPRRRRSSRCAADAPAKRRGWRAACARLRARGRRLGFVRRGRSASLCSTSSSASSN